MQQTERYLFDLRGYIVLRSVLDDGEMNTLREEVSAGGAALALDDHPSIHAGFPTSYFDDGSWAGAKGPKYWTASAMLEWGPHIRSLVGDVRLGSYLRALLGDSYRLDHAYGVFARKGAGQHPLHNGGTPYDPSQAYVVRDGVMHNSMVVAQYALTDAVDGGFWCVPGSHKSSFPLPEEWLCDTSEAPVELVALRAGDVLIFTEALTHGSPGWVGAHDRWALLYKYCPGSVQWESASPFVSRDRYEWNERQRRVLEPPYAGGRHVIDG